MAMIKCKMCGGDMELSPDRTFGTCEYCGSTMTLPRVSDEQRAALFNRGNHFRRLGEFDKALAIYENIVREDENDAEAHWCCALCRFGIEYVEDPTTYEYVPTCHRASFDSILEDVDYKAALEHSDGVTRRQYQRDAAKIAEVQWGILATVNKEEPFDVFLCYKETDEQTGQRSRDSLDAQEVYYRLTEKGYRVFFARITLEDKAGAEFEPYIFAALQSAKVMIVLGEKPEHFSAVWVKNEWSRYLALMKKDRSRLLIPCYKNMDPYDLPEQLSVLQSYDMSRIGFIQDLIRGVGKVLDAEKPKETAPAPAQTVVREVVQSTGGVNLNAQIKRGQIALEDRDWAAADAFFDKALDMDAECAEAYFGKALAAEKCANGEELVQRRLAIPVTDSEELVACEHNDPIQAQLVKDLVVPGLLSAEAIRERFSYDKRTYLSLTSEWKRRLAGEALYWKNDRLLSRAVRYAKGEFAETLTGLKKQIIEKLRGNLEESKEADARKKEAVAARYAQQTERAVQSIREWHEAALAKREEEYKASCEAQERADDRYAFGSVAAMFERVELRDYKDSKQRAEACRAEVARQQAEEKARLEAAAKAAAEEAERKRILAEQMEAARKAKRKKAAVIIIGTLSTIVAIILLIIKVIVPGVNYNRAVALLNQRDFDGAIEILSALGDYKDSKEKAVEARHVIAYAEAETLLADGETAKAAIAFYALSGYLDAKSRSSELWYKIVDHSSLAAGTFHTVGLCADGTVVAVGRMLHGQLKVEDWKDIIEVAAGREHTVGLCKNGRVFSVGNNNKGQKYTNEWVDIVDVAVGSYHTVGLRMDGTLLVTGSNSNGQCNISAWKNIIAVSAGTNHTVGLRADGKVFATGSNSNGQCNVSKWTDIVAIAAGNDHTLGLRADGSVVSAGSNKSNQCNVDDWENVIAIAAGDYHSLGLKSDGTVFSTGKKKNGQCNVKGWSDIVQIVAGDNHTVGLRADGTVLAVGLNADGQCKVSDWMDIKIPNH